MKKSGILHRELSAEIASLGHGDIIVIGDSGLPVPKGTKCIDLAVCQGTPPFLNVLATVLKEMVVEKAVVAEELSSNIELTNQIKQSLGDNTPIRQISHNQFKELSKDAKAVIRTGEWTPYANIALIAGVAF